MSKPESVVVPIKIDVDTVRRVVDERVYELLGVKSASQLSRVEFAGNVSGAMLGKLVAQAGLVSPFVLVDLRDARQIMGKRPMWRPG